MNLVYLTLEHAIHVHAKTVEVSGGGMLGALEVDKLDGVLTHIQNDDYYPTFEAKLAHLFFCACKFHCFQDGNKRIAITLCAQLLLLNGYLYCTDRFIRSSENISYHVAAGRIDKDLLQEFITAVLYGDEDDESLKLKILNAIASDSSQNSDLDPSLGRATPVREAEERGAFKPRDVQRNWSSSI